MSLMFTGDQAPSELSLELSGERNEDDPGREMGLPSFATLSLPDVRVQSITRKLASLHL